MSNFDFSKQLNKLTVKSIMATISEAAPFLLLFLAVGTFVGVGIFQTDYYRHIFAPRFASNAGVMAVFVAVLHQAIRFGLLVASMRDFSDNRAWNGWLGLIGSLALVVYDVKVAGWLAQVWATGGIAEAATYKSTVVFLILLGLLLEYRLILTVDGTKFGKPGNVQPAPKIPNAATKSGYQYSANGKH